MYTAVDSKNLNRKNQQSIHGFKSEQEATEWIKNNILCEKCLKAMEIGYEIFYTKEGKEFRHDILDIDDTGCGCYWYIIKTEELNKEEDI
jgi:hypothetical protein